VALAASVCVYLFVTDFLIFYFVHGAEKRNENNKETTHVCV
jgi:hypothetical protein